MFKIRVISGAVMTVVMCAVLYFSHVTAVLNWTVLLLSAIGIGEMYKAAKVKNKWIILLSAVVVITISFADLQYYEFYMSIFMIIVFAAAWCLMKSVDKKRSVDLWTPLILSVFILTSFKTMFYIREMEDGLYLLICSVLICWIADTCAYLVGRKLGKHKLAPKISPNKSVEGAIGGLVLTVAIIFFGTQAYYGSTPMNVDTGIYIMYLIVATLLSQFGDLTFSSVKRIVNIKDYSHMIPGHGGILDRFDSMLFVLPFTYLLFVFI